MSLPVQQKRRAVRRRAAITIDCSEEPLIREIRRRHLTYLSIGKLASIANTCLDIERKGLPGAFIEAGCALGGSSILIATVKDKSRPFGVYDVFGMIPPPTEDDTEQVHQRYKVIVEGKSQGIGGERYYGYEDNLMEKVRNNFVEFGIDTDTRQVTLIKGLLQDTMHPTGDIAFAHIDVDWYDPVRTSFERVFPHLVVGGSIIFDDYFDWGGCRKAVDECLLRVGNAVVTDSSAGSLKITRIRV